MQIIVKSDPIQTVDLYMNGKWARQWFNITSVRLDHPTKWYIKRDDDKGETMIELSDQDTLIIEPQANR